MFEQEIEMEKRESSVVPLLLIVAMIILIVGAAGYFVWQNKQVLSSADAGNTISALLRQQGPAKLRFRVGTIQPNMYDRPGDPHYKLLQKAGIVKLGKAKDNQYPVTITGDGEKLLAEIPGMTKTVEKDGNTLYVVPLAERRLVEVSKITMKSATRATVVYSWKWEPTKMGELFDASGALVKGFNTWERSTLIDKYGADFYHGEATKVQILLGKSDTGTWEPAID